MSKAVLNQRYIYKIHSSRFKINNWKLILTKEEAKQNDEIISIGDSITLRMIRRIKKMNVKEKQINKVKEDILKLKNKKTSDSNKEKIKNLYEKLHKLTFIEDYISIIFDSVEDWKTANSDKTPVILNDKEYVRLVGTNGGVKKNTVVFCNKEIFDNLDKRLNNGRDKTKKYVPAKFESYKALACSGSTPVTQPKGVLVIKDGITNIKDDVLQLTNDKDNPGLFKLNSVKDYDIERAFTDGCGMISKELSDQWCIDMGCYKYDDDGNKINEYTPTGFNIRNSWCKGMVFTFPYLEFANEVAKNYIVKDVWGNDIDIRNVQLIITTNMLKLWDSYTSIEHYLSCCKENGFEFCVAKILPKELELVRNMNYQFLQSYDFTDDDIEELIKPTVDKIVGATYLDYKKSLLFLKGINITEKDFNKENFDYVKALMINKNMIYDPFVKQRIYKMIKKKINDAKKGVLQVKGCYSVVSGDLYALCQYMFGMKVTGLLKANEFYSCYWLDKNVKKVVAYRAPMSCHNNIKIFNFIRNNKTNKWYRYMKTCTILNAWDTTWDAMNGMDADGDAVITTNNRTLLKRTKELPTVICEQKVAEKKIIKPNLLRDANKNGFGNDVGGVTNKCTSMFDVLASFNKGSKEYNIVNERIIHMQGYQQEVIDSVKGIVAKEVPREWYSYKLLKVEKKDSFEVKQEKLYKQSLASIKKPYFFIYNYPHIMSKYKKYISNSNTNCLIKFGLTIEELKNKKDKNEDELDFIEYYYKLLPVFTHPSTMNRICWKLEEKLDELKIEINNKYKFDYSILKSNNTYNKAQYNKVKNKIEEIYEKYKIKSINYNSNHNKLKSKKQEKEERQQLRKVFVETFKEECYKVCNNKEMLCDIIIDTFYIKDENKQFVWDICGDTIINNLLKRNNNYFNILVKDDENGDIEWDGMKFKIEKIKKEESLC